MKRLIAPFFFIVLLTIGISGQAVVAERAISVDAGQVKWWDYDLSESARLWGKFRAAGGKNDIEVYIVDDDGLENLKNGNQFEAYYSSGRVTVGTFDKRLPRGSYHLVFSNKWSLMTPKAVTVQFYSEGSPRYK